MKTRLGEKITTVFVRQGHHATEAAGMVIAPPPDLTVEAIGDLLKCDASYFRTTTPRRV
jgi:hypothetical protein